MIAKKDFRISWQELEFRELVGPVVSKNGSVTVCNRDTHACAWSVS